MSFYFFPALGHGIGPPQAVSILARHAREGGCPRLAIDERSHGYPGSGQVAGPGHDSEEEARSLLPPPPRWPSMGAGWGGDVFLFFTALGHGIGPPQAVSILARHAREGGCPRLA